MKWKESWLAPALICAGVTAAFCAIEWLGESQPHFTAAQRLEWITYDWRVREAAKHSPPIATNLGFVVIDDDSIDALLNRSLPYQFGLLWPRQVYARLVDELSAQGAKAIGFDVLFADLRPDHPPARIDGKEIGSDEFFARSLRRAGNVVLASEVGLYPPDWFATNALAVGEISADPDKDGILRRPHAFVDMRIWHPAIKSAAGQYGWKLSESKLQNGKLLFPRGGDEETDAVPLNAQGEFDAGALEAGVAVHDERPVVHRFERPFHDERLWHLGLVLAAHELNLDLRRAAVDREHGRILLSNAPGLTRVIPIDREGRFLIDWSLTSDDSRLAREKIENLLRHFEDRRAGDTRDWTNQWAGKLVVVGSIAGGNNLNDFGATPLGKRTYLVSSYWNTANSLLMNRFIHSLERPWRLLIIVLFGVLAGICTWKMRTLGAVGSVLGIGVAYIALAWWLFIASRIWLPIVTPVFGSLLVTQVSLIVYLVRVERRARQRTREVFSKVVAPDIVRELLNQDEVSVGGVRRTVTILFADIRGFTAVTDASQKRAEVIVNEQKLSGEAAQNRYDAEAETVLNTVNPYLSLLADIIKKHGGTLDKYIGDCVMAFWGAPISSPRHAVRGVRAIIEAQRAIFEFNQLRAAENSRRYEENLRRLAGGKTALPMLDILSLGSGINTGVVTIGCVGSENHGMNYTVFGREVNLASRLEGASGRARVLISEATYRELLRDDPGLAATCKEQPPLPLKGFSDAIKAYEVPWHRHDLTAIDAGQTGTIIRDASQREDVY